MIAVNWRQSCGPSNRQYLTLERALKLVPEMEFTSGRQAVGSNVCLNSPTSTIGFNNEIAKLRCCLLVYMSSRAGLRLFQSARLSRAYTKKPLGRRYQTADTTAAPPEGIIQRLWNSPVGVKTVHFW